MSRFPYNKYQESGEEWAAARGYLARPSETPQDILERKRERVDGENQLKERDARLSETFNTLNEMVQQIYYCYNCYYCLNRLTEVKIGHNFCGHCGNRINWASKI